MIVRRAEKSEEDPGNLVHVVQDILDTLNTELAPGVEQTNALACVMTNILARNFYSENDAHEALSLFEHSVAAVMEYASKNCLTSWRGEGEVGN